jgi:hypothetical protein
LPDPKKEEMHLWEATDKYGKIIKISVRTQENLKSQMASIFEANVKSLECLLNFFDFSRFLLEYRFWYEDKQKNENISIFVSSAKWRRNRYFSPEEFLKGNNPSECRDFDPFELFDVEKIHNMTRYWWSESELFIGKTSSPSHKKLSSISWGDWNLAISCDIA